MVTIGSDADLLIEDIALTRYANWKAIRKKFSKN